MDNSGVAPNLNYNYNSLNIVNFYPVPHYTNFPYQEAVEEIILKYETKLPLILIDNSQVILVNGNSVKVCSKSII